MAENETNNNESCIICLESISHSNKAVIKGCSHEFCYECIRSWAHTNLSCPLCKQEFTTLHHTFQADGTFAEEVISQPPPAQAVPVEDQLGCLDHTFFLTEVSRLLQTVERIQKKLWVESVGRGLDLTGQRNLVVAEEVCVELRNHKRKLQALLHFEPHVVLQDLYRLQAVIDRCFFPEPEPLIPPVRYSAADAWDGDLPDEEEDLIDDMTDLSLSKNRSKSKNQNQVFKVQTGVKQGKSHQLKGRQRSRK